jgi:hypothetical protein
LSAKITWSFVGCKDENNTSDAIEERIQRWEKSACSEGKKLLEGSKEVMRQEDNKKHESILSGLKQRYENFEKSNIKNMPNLIHIFNQLGENYKIYSKIRIAFYSIFNNAVHLDPVSMSEIYLSQQHGKDSTRSYCAAIAYHINSLIRTNYGIDIQQITDEFNQLTNMT